MRVGVIALLHESNTFISQPTTIEHFRQSLLATGESFREQVAGAHHESAGFFEGLEQTGIEAAPLMGARAIPFGPLTANTMQQLVETLMAQLDAAGPLDGILVAPHGATVSAAQPDADGYWLSEVRRKVGPQTPIIGTLDAHANLSPLMVESTDALIAYRTNPHLDQKQRGLQAAALMAQTLRGEVKPTQAAAFPRLAINIERQETSAPHCRPLYDAADQMLERSGVMANSILLGFPYADVHEMGSSVIVVTDNDPALAEQCAAELGDRMWDMREDFDGKLIEIDAALDQAATLEGPICLLDMGDNVGGGSPADGVHLASEIHRRNMDRSFVCLYDPQSVEQAEAAGVGAALTLQVGGKTDRLHGEPLEASFTVTGLYDGRFEESEPRHGGIRAFDQGRCAVVQTMTGLTVLLNSIRTPPFSLQQLESCNLDPSSYHLLIAKGVNAPVAAYAPICKHLIRVNTPGVTTADMTRLTYHHRRRPLFPFEKTF